MLKFSCRWLLLPGITNSILSNVRITGHIPQMLDLKIESDRKKSGQEEYPSCTAAAWTYYFMGQELSEKLAEFSTYHDKQQAPA